jgi:hypothetical protein
MVTSIYILVIMFLSFIKVKRTNQW